MSTSLAMNESRTWESLSKVDRFVRIHFLFFTCLWPLLGAISVKPDLSIGELSALMVAALAYHLYAFVLNDVIDLPIDRTQPLMPYRELPGQVTKLPPFGQDEGQPWGRIQWQDRLRGSDQQVSPAIAVQVGQRRALSDSSAHESGGHHNGGIEE